MWPNVVQHFMSLMQHPMHFQSVEKQEVTRKTFIFSVLGLHFAMFAQLEVIGCCSAIPLSFVEENFSSRVESPLQLQQVSVIFMLEGIGGHIFCCLFCHIIHEGWYGSGSAVHCVNCRH